MESPNTAQPTSGPIDPMDKLSPVPDQSSQQIPQLGSTPPASQSPAQPVVPTPPPPTPPETPFVEPTYAKPRSRGPLVLLVSLFIVLLLIIGAGAATALIAYGKIDINNPELQRKISFAVQALPFTPKTAEYLIYNTFDANKNVKSAAIDASIALTGSEPIIPGLSNNFDLKIAGLVDMHDKEKPEVEVNVKSTPELDADLVIVNEKIFFKINSLPSYILGMASGAGYSLDIIMNKWIWNDLSELESEARSTLDEDKDARDEERFERVKMAILNSSVIDKIVVKDGEIDSNPVYQLDLELTSEEYLNFLNEVSKAVDPEAYGNDYVANSDGSQSFDDLKITTFIDKDTMHTVRSMISFRLSTDLDIPTQVLGASTIQYFPNVYTQAVNPEDNHMDVAIVINGSRFNEDFQIAEPQGATPFQTIVEEYTRQMMEASEMEGSGFEVDDSSGFGDTDEPMEDEDTGISPY